MVQTPKISQDEPIKYMSGEQHHQRFQTG